MAILGSNPTTIVVTVVSTDTPLPSGVSYAGTMVTVTDNSGAVLPAIQVNGSESPAWTATFSGSAGSVPAVAVLQAVDTAGNAIGDSFTLTESGAGGITVPFPLPTGGTISVTSLGAPAPAPVPEPSPSFASSKPNA